MRKLTNTLVVATVVAFNGLLLPGVLFASGGVRTIVLTDDSFPMLDIGLSFKSALGIPAINADGRTAFWGSFSETGDSFGTKTGLFSEGSDGVIKLVANEGGEAVGTDQGTEFSRSFGEVNINKNGQTQFEITLRGPGVDSSSDSAIVREEINGALTLVMRDGDPVPGTEPGISFFAYLDPLFNDQGQSAFGSFLQGAGVPGSLQTAAFFSDPCSGGAPLGREDDIASPAGDGAIYASIAQPVLNNVGQMAFRAILRGAGQGDQNNDAIFRGSSSQGTSIVIRKGDPVPDFETGTTFFDFQPGLSINDAGDVAFLGSFTGGGLGVFVC